MVTNLKLGYILLLVTISVYPYPKFYTLPSCPIQGPFYQIKRFPFRYTYCPVCLCMRVTVRASLTLMIPLGHAITHVRTKTRREIPGDKDDQTEET